MTDPCAPYIDAHGCTVWPACPPITYVPARIVQQPVIGWNAGANSITELDDDLHAVFTMPAGVAGVVIGLRAGRTFQTQPDLIEHGLYFNTVGVTNLVHVMERGKAKTSPIERAADDSFEIRRSQGKVTYHRNGAAFYVSAAPSTGVKVVNSCLYASGDEV